VRSAARTLAVVHCVGDSDSMIRIISARNATRKKLHFMKKEYDFSKLKELKNPYAGKKKAVGINLSPQVVDYFKGLADETGLPYQKLIDLYLLDCAKKRKKLTMKWVA
jgi:predicted DNA binding CopG/RHH family protein